VDELTEERECFIFVRTDQERVRIRAVQGAEERLTFQYGSVHGWQPGDKCVDAPVEHRRQVHGEPLRVDEFSEWCRAEAAGPVEVEQAAGCPQEPFRLSARFTGFVYAEAGRV